MAEERIRVLVSKNPCEKCEIKPCTRKCMFATLFEKAPGMTRAEAIDRIAKSLCKEERMYCVCGNNVDFCEKERIHCAYWADAEEALNALLER